MARRRRDRIALVASLVLLLAAGAGSAERRRPRWPFRRLGREPGHCGDNSLKLLLHRTSQAGLAGVAAALMPAWEDPWATTADVDQAPRGVVHFDNKPGRVHHTPPPGVGIGTEHCSRREQPSGPNSRRQTARAQLNRRTELRATSRPVRTRAHFGSTGRCGPGSSPPGPGSSSPGPGPGLASSSKKSSRAGTWDQPISAAASATKSST